MFRILFVCLLTLLLMACIGGVSTPTKFYSLNKNYKLNNTNSTLLLSRPISVGVGPISLPDSLNRPQIVTYSGGNQLVVAEFHHWAGDLKNNVTNVLKGHLMQGLRSNKVFSYPWPRNENPEFIVRIDIMDFSGSLGGKVKFNGTWTLNHNENNSASEVYAFSFTKKLNDNSYTTLVESMSAQIELLSVQIVEYLTAGKK